MKICQTLSQLKNYTNQLLENFKKRKVYLHFIDNIWRADLADMQLITKLNKRIRFLLCVINIFSKYAWVTPLKNEKGNTITNAFQKNLDKFGQKANEIWVDKGREFSNRPMKS